MKTLPYPNRIGDALINRELRNVIDALNLHGQQLDDLATAADVTTPLLQGNLVEGNFVVAADANTVKDSGFAPGLSVTVTLAKLTGGGANGSLTFVNGQLTAVTQPT